MDAIVKELITSGLAGLTAGMVLVLLLKPAIESSIKHSYDKIVERLKAESTLVTKRYDAAERGLAELQELITDIESEIQNLSVTPGEDFFGNLITTVHPKYRRRFLKLRSNFETANDIISAYSLEYEHLIHPNNIEQLIIVRAAIKKPGDIKYAYRNIWMTSMVGMRALLRATSGYEFWEPKNYGERAQRWAEHDRYRTEQFLLDLMKRSIPKDRIFYLLLEQEGAQDAFWTSEPKEWANK